MDQVAEIVVGDNLFPWFSSFVTDQDLVFGVLLTFVVETLVVVFNSFDDLGSKSLTILIR